MPLYLRYLIVTGILLVFPQTLTAQTFADASDLLPDARFDAPLGATLVDVNNDGRIDMYRRFQLYIQQPDGTFTDEHAPIGLNEGSGVVFGAILADYNEDGFADLFFMDLVNPSKLFRNRAGMQFTQTNNETGIRGQDLVQGSLWTDYNQDGLVDLFVGIDGGISNLFVNSSSHQFTNVTEQAGLVYQATYGTAAADYDRDGDMDIFLTQCLPPQGSTIAENVLLDLENGVFRNVSQSMGIADNLASWGTVWLDYNNDGWLDIYTANIAGNTGSAGINTLYRNNEGVSFTDVSTEASVAGVSNDENFGVSAADFDNDGWTDIIVANRTGSAYLYRNNGDGTFEDIVPSLPVKPANSTAISVADINNDGWIDVFIPEFGNDQLLMNEGGTNHFIKIYARGTLSNHYGIGARIDLYAGGLRQVREIQAGDGMTSQNHNLSAHFGLGQQTIIDSLIVRWPSGSIDRFTSIDSDQEITIVEQTGINNAPSPFALIAASGITLPDGETLFQLNWEEATDPEQDALSYTVHIAGSTVDTTIASLDTNSLILPPDLFQTGETYKWTVHVTDGYSVRGTLFNTFEFGQSVNIELPGDKEPLITNQLHAFPNPFQSSTTIPYEVLHTEQVEVTVYNILGQRTADLINRRHAPGQYTITWNGRDAKGQKAAPGVYIIRLEAESGQFTRLITRR